MLLRLAQSRRPNVGEIPSRSRRNYRVALLACQRPFAGVSRGAARRQDFDDRGADNADLRDLHAFCAVVEQGTHDELLEENGLYARLYRAGEWTVARR